VPAAAPNKYYIRFTAQPLQVAPIASVHQTCFFEKSGFRINKKGLDHLVKPFFWMLKSIPPYCFNDL
jgi:hypothetical protein